MKKLFPLVLSFIMIISLTACSVEKTKKVYDASKAAYTNIKAAYEIVDAFGTDVYEAWRIGIFEENEIKDGGCEYLSKELNISKDDILDSVYRISKELYGSGWDDSWDELYSEKIADNLLVSYGEATENFSKWCVKIVLDIYNANGKAAETQGYLDEAKSQMQSVSKIYSDYVHYPALKGFYTTASSFFDLCQNPEGSFVQLKTAMENYKSTARDYISDLDYIFEN